MSSVLAGLHARREAIKTAIKQAVSTQFLESAREDGEDRDDALWDLQRQLESLHVQIAAYERAQANT